MNLMRVSIDLLISDRMLISPGESNYETESQLYITHGNYLDLKITIDSLLVFHGHICVDTRQCRVLKSIPEWNITIVCGWAPIQEHSIIAGDSRSSANNEMFEDRNQSSF